MRILADTNVRQDAAEARPPETPKRKPHNAARAAKGDSDAVAAATSIAGQNSSTERVTSNGRPLPKLVGPADVRLVVRGAQRRGPDPRLTLLFGPDRVRDYISF